jgi:hypothetical protein
MMLSAAIGISITVAGISTYVIDVYNLLLYTSFMALALITVVETQSYLAAAKGLLSEAERAAVIDMVAADPQCGVALGGGIRKVRIGVDGRGKRGGGRVVYLYAGQDIPVFLMTVFAKNEMANLSRSEQAGLAEIAASIIQDYRRR